MYITILIINDDDVNDDNAYDNVNVISKQAMSWNCNHTSIMAAVQASSVVPSYDTTHAITAEQYRNYLQSRANKHVNLNIASLQHRDVTITYIKTI